MIFVIIYGPPFPLMIGISIEVHVYDDNFKPPFKSCEKGPTQVDKA